MHNGSNILRPDPRNYRLVSASMSLWLFVIFCFQDVINSEFQFANGQPNWSVDILSPGQSCLSCKNRHILCNNHELISVILC